MCHSLSQVVAAARALVAGLAGVPAAELPSAFEGFAELERLAVAGKLALAPRLAGSGVKSAGDRSVEDWMARASGASPGEVKKLVDVAEKLDGLPATRAALGAGELSLAQAAAVAEAAAAQPDAESSLLDAARTETVRSLRERSRKVVLDSRGSGEERYARQRRLRSFAHWTDDEGMVAGRFRLTPDDGAALVNAVRREADRHYRRAYGEGRRESPENYAADALVGLVTGQGRLGPTGSRATDVVVVVSHASLRRGRVDPDPAAGEICEVPGFGAVPVERARELMADAFLKGVVWDGKRVTHVRHFGRHRPAEVDTALLAEAVLRHGRVQCAVPGCDRTVGIEWDHEVPFARGGTTSVDNLQPLCRWHHSRKSAAELAGPAP